MSPVQIWEEPPKKIDQLTRWSFFFVETQGSEELFLIFTEGAVISSSLGGVTKNEDRLIRWFFLVTPKKEAVRLLLL